MPSNRKKLDKITLFRSNACVPTGAIDKSYRPSKIPRKFRSGHAEEIDAIEYFGYGRKLNDRLTSELCTL